MHKTCKTLLNALAIYGDSSGEKGCEGTGAGEEAPVRSKLPYPTYEDGDIAVKTELLYEYFRGRYGNWGQANT